MNANASSYATQLRLELGARNRVYACGRLHVESYGNPPVIVYAPEGDRHGNFFDPAYQAIRANPQWLRRFDKVHAQGARSLPKLDLNPPRRWRELDSSMSSDALLMNVFCTPAVVNSAAVRSALGVEETTSPVFGWKARVPFANGRFDRTEVDMRWGSLLVEAKLTEADFQTREARLVESYRGFDEVFDRELLPVVQLPTVRRKQPFEFPEAYSQEQESLIDTIEQGLMNSAAMNESSASFAAALEFNSTLPSERGYSSYQLIRNVLAAYASQSSFCVIHDARRLDLREQWFQVMAAVKSAEVRVRLKVLTWQELSAIVPVELQDFLDAKYGIAAPGMAATPVDDVRMAE